MRGSQSEVVGGEPPRGFHLDVRAHGFAMTDAIRTYATDHVAGRLAKHARGIQTVVVRFDDVNGSKGGADMLCEVEVTLRRGTPIVVTELDDDLRAAMARAADRVEEAVTRALARRRDTSRQRGHKLVRERKTMT
jgi:putative sigma-54 modulation protein